MSLDTKIGGSAPNDGRDWDCQCARCGSSMHFVDCDNCGGDGVSGHDCGEDTCCCAEPEDDVECDWCDGDGGHWECISTSAWCQAHPLEHRAEIASGTPEWFALPAAQETPEAER